MMATRDTTTGSNYEQIIEMCLTRSCEKNALGKISQSNVGIKPGGGKHRVDWEIYQLENENIRGLISCKFQKSSGTAEEKIAYEVIKLLHTMQTDLRFTKSWIVMGGDGWSSGMKSFVREDLPKWIPEMKNKVTILNTDEFINTEISI
jgi:hypothetical protein